MNGATVKRSDYPRLVQFATDNGLWTSDPENNPQLFGQGDGSTTFVLPNYRNRVIQGGDTVGVKSAGLPNITGSTMDVPCFPTSIGGAFSFVPISAGNGDAGSAWTKSGHADFDASKVTAFMAHLIQYSPLQLY